LELHWTWRTQQLPQIQTLWNFIGLEELDNFPKFNTFKLDNFLKFNTFWVSVWSPPETWQLPQIQTLSFSHNQCQSSSLVFHREENPTEEDPRGFKGGHPSQIWPRAPYLNESYLGDTSHLGEESLLPTSFRNFVYIYYTSSDLTMLHAFSKSNWPSEKLGWKVKYL
jgi:hypothetical protein